MIKQKLHTLPALRASVYLYGLVILVFSAFIVSCEDNPDINYLTYDDQVIGPEPTILSITPPGSEAFASYTIVTITGEHFSPDSGGNLVYFSGVPAQIQSESATEIVVLAPDKVGTDLQVNVVVAGALEIATVPYSLEQLSIENPGIGNAEKTVCLAIDNNENIYAMLADTRVMKIFPNGDSTTYGSTNFRAAGEMRIGPGGALYIQRTSQRTLFRIPPGGGEAEEFITFPESVGGQTVRLTSFDFDEHGNIFAGGVGGGLVVFNTLGNSFGTEEYLDGAKIKSIRVYDGYVYLGLEDGVWRNEILSDTGNVGSGTMVFDWDDAGSLSNSDLKSITIAADGDILIGSANTSATSLDPILVVHPDGTSEPLYPGQLTLPATQMVWGNGNFVYVNRMNRDEELRRIIRVNLLKPGAPYFGRGS